jgi:hypothetical protein
MITAVGKVAQLPPEECQGIRVMLHRGNHGGTKYEAVYRHSI